ncbi:MAG: hypothetical protein IJW45_04620, partial [Oscillospiraceae bacterium]|nr:hypothetical protein [Oscillospiraceae bacterium]
MLVNGGDIAGAIVFSAAKQAVLFLELRKIYIVHIVRNPKFQPSSRAYDIIVRRCGRFFLLPISHRMYNQFILRNKYLLILRGRDLLMFRKIIIEAG